ncbi:MAG: hypothetical protein ABIQ09_00460 [Jatrophihabitantaceae bacterium]
MRKFWSLALASVLALATFFLVSPAANAFGAEVLGCKYGTTSWTANSCGPGLGVVTFSPNNLSGDYSYGWTITEGVPITTPCSSTSGAPCISAGCTTTSSTCAVKVQPSQAAQRRIVASLVLYQSGQSRTIQATAIVAAPCINFC